MLFRKKKKAILFTGSFDPIHIGHMKVIKFLAHKYPKRTIYVMPQFYKEKKAPLLSLKTRIEMVHLAVQEIDNVEVSMLAYGWAKDGRSLYKMAKLLKEGEEIDQLDLAIGNDVLIKLETFAHPVDLIKEFKFIVIERKKGLSWSVANYFAKMAKKDIFSMREITEYLAKNQILISSDKEPIINSTQIREDLGTYQWWIPEEARLAIIAKLENGEEL